MKKSSIIKRKRKNRQSARSERARLEKQKYMAHAAKLVRPRLPKLPEGMYWRGPLTEYEAEQQLQWLWKRLYRFLLRKNCSVYRIEVDFSCTKTGEMYVSRVSDSQKAYGGFTVEIAHTVEGLALSSLKVGRFSAVYEKNVWRSTKAHPQGFRDGKPCRGYVLYSAARMLDELQAIEYRLVSQSVYDRLTFKGDRKYPLGDVANVLFMQPIFSEREVLNERNTCAIRWRKIPKSKLYQGRFTPYIPKSRTGVVLSSLPGEAELRYILTCYWPFAIGYRVFHLADTAALRYLAIEGSEAELLFAGRDTFIPTLDPVTERVVGAASLGRLPYRDELVFARILEPTGQLSLFEEEELGFDGEDSDACRYGCIEAAYRMEVKGEQSYEFRGGPFQRVILLESDAYLSLQPDTIMM